MTRRTAQRRTQEIGEALLQAGFDHVVANVDKEAICYLSGPVPTQWHEAEAVRIAFDLGAEAVVDGMTHPGHVPPNLHQTQHFVQSSFTNPEPFSEHDDRSEGSAADHLLGRSDLSHRLFDASGRLTIHSPVGVAS